MFGVFITNWFHYYLNCTVARNGKYIAVQYGMMTLPALVSDVLEISSFCLFIFTGDVGACCLFFKKNIDIRHIS